MPTTKPNAKELLAHQAHVKRLTGKALSVRESEAIEWLANSQKAAIADRAYRRVPKSHFCEMVDRHRKTVDEFAGRHNLPLTGASIDLYDALKAMYAMLVDSLEVLRSLGEEEGEGGLKEEKTRQEIEKLKRQVQVLEIDIRRRNDSLVPREMVAESLGWLAGKMQGMGKRLHKKFGVDAQNVVNEFLNELKIEIESGTLKF